MPVDKKPWHRACVSKNEAAFAYKFINVQEGIKMENKTRKKPQGWLVLFLVSLVAALALAGTNELTRDAIAQRALEAADAARRAVLNNAETFEQLQVPAGIGVDNGYRGVKEGQAVGYVAQSTVKGYGGEIEVVVGMDLNGTLTGISVGGPSFSETAGLGDKAKAPAFTEQFKGLTLPAKLTDNVDAISGATITSNAVVLGVNQAGTYLTSVAGANDKK
jgi:electron transport complex protein RnfG